MARRIAIVMAYYERKALLDVTMATIRSQCYPDYSVIVVDDASPTPLQNAPDLTVVRVEPENKKWKSVVAWNIGLNEALKHDPEIIIVQNPECYHYGKVLSLASEIVSQDRCISYACWSLDQSKTLKEHDVLSEIARDNPFRTDGGSTGWYNHPTWNPRYYHFCTALHVETMVKLNGFDERLKDTVGFDDDDLVRRINLLGVRFHATDQEGPFVVHQWHDRDSYDLPWELYNTFRFEGNYRATHLVTPDLEIP